MNIESTENRKANPEQETEHEASEQKPDKSPRTLLERLGPELFQTETSAMLHGRREADRLGDTPPAQALRPGWRAHVAWRRAASVAWSARCSRRSATRWSIA
jgi:hypothetical protein